MRLFILPWAKYGDPFALTCDIIVDAMLPALTCCTLYHVSPLDYNVSFELAEMNQRKISVPSDDTSIIYLSRLLTVCSPHVSQFFFPSIPRYCKGQLHNDTLATDNSLNSKIVFVSGKERDGKNTAIKWWTWHELAFICINLIIEIGKNMKIPTKRMARNAGSFIIHR